MTRITIISGLSRWLLLGILITVPIASAESAQSEEPQPLQKADVVEIIDTVLSAYEAHYVYPDTARALSEHIRGKLEDGAYDDVTDVWTIAERLRSDLREFTHDRHIYISVMSPDDPPSIGETVTEEQIARAARRNFRFRKAEWLMGNVGYLRIDGFEDAVYAGEAASAAMNFLARCSAVIIDLRYNGGGHETMVRFLASYFFERPTQINALYFPETDSLEQSWTSAHVPGQKLVDADLYILISNRTASGAEAFSYGMKHSGRAVLVGETTAGAAHWTEAWDFPNLRIRADIPIARPINPVTKTSWERTGVIPHIESSADKALSVAHLEAMKRIIERTHDDQQKAELAWDMVPLEAEVNAFELTTEEMREYTGEFDNGRYVVYVENGSLRCRYEGREEYTMIPLSTDLFGFDDTDSYRVEIVRDSNDAVTGFRLLIRGRGPSPIKEKTGDL